MAEQENNKMDVGKGGIIFYTAPDGRTRLECRFENESIWLTQQMIAELFGTSNCQRIFDGSI